MLLTRGPLCPSHAQLEENSRLKEELMRKTRELDRIVSPPPPPIPFSMPPPPANYTEKMIPFPIHQISVYCLGVLLASTASAHEHLYNALQLIHHVQISLLSLPYHTTHDSPIFISTE
jgi:hypothetical protein